MSDDKQKRLPDSLKDASKLYRRTSLEELSSVLDNLYREEGDSSNAADALDGSQSQNALSEDNFAPSCKNSLLNNEVQEDLGVFEDTAEGLYLIKKAKRPAVRYWQKSDALRPMYRFVLEMILLTSAFVSGLVCMWFFSSPQGSNQSFTLIIAGIFVVSVVLSVRLFIDPEKIKARQSHAVLSLASQTLKSVRFGLTQDAAQEICNLLLPATSAIAVAITDSKIVLGYAGIEQFDSKGGTPIKTAATYSTLKDGSTQILRSQEDIGFPTKSDYVQAGIIVPLKISGKTIGTLKFYFNHPKLISPAQISIAEGFGELLSTQLAAIELEKQTQLATSMELKVLQSQINPHFLFNTINTIASFIRTDPLRARELLREFASFYRSALKNSDDFIELRREIEQVERYFTFELARFGSERIALETSIAPELVDFPLPAFLIQPLVENAVRHGLKSEGKLTIRIEALRSSQDIIITVSDDGKGMSNEVLTGILHPKSQEGLGIAVKNIHDRIKALYGSGASMEIASQVNRGTQVRLVLAGAFVQDAEEEL